MEIRKITEHTILEFGEYLALEEKSERTIEKYLRDLRAFFRFVGEKALCKEQSIAYKQRLLDAGYAARSVNSMLAAVNKLFPGLMLLLDAYVLAFQSRIQSGVDRIVL